jgi:hypothetical protein
MAQTPRDVRSLLSLVAALAVIAVAARPVNLILHTPKTYYSSGGFWIGAIVAAAMILAFSYALWRREHWARWVLATVLTAFGAFTLELALASHSHDLEPAYLVIERIRGLLLLVLALTVFASDRVHEHITGIAHRADGDTVDEDRRQTAAHMPRREAGNLQVRRKDRWLAAGAILAGLWFFLSAYSVLFDLQYFIKSGSSLGPRILPPVVDISMSALSALATALSAWAFMAAPSRLRYACLFAPLLSIICLLTNYFIGTGGVAINLILLALAVFNWRKLGSHPDDPSGRQLPAS